MSLIAKDKSTPLDPAPQGLHQAVCVDVVDNGLVKGQYGEQEKCTVYWQIDEVNPKTNKRFIVTRRYTISLNDKAALTKDLNAWRGKPFTVQEKEGFDLEKLLGANCQLQIVHNPGDDGKVWANVQAIVPLAKGMAKLEPLDYVRKKDRKDAEAADAPAPDAGEDVPF